MILIYLRLHPSIDDPCSKCLDFQSRPGEVAHHHHRHRHHHHLQRGAALRKHVPMVAFGHYIEHLKTCKPEWASRFLNYGNLKTIISRIREVSQTHSDDEADSDEEIPFVCYSEDDLKIYKGAAPVTAEEVYDQFRIAVTHEIDKAGLFHSKLIDHFRDSLDNQVDAFWSGTTGGPLAVPHPDNPKYWHSRRLCENLYQEVSTLKHFSGTHRTAIRKIIKKFNKEMKRCGREDLQLDTAEYVNRYNEKAQDPHGGGYSNLLLDNIEETYAEFHSCENIQEARRKLKASAQHHGQDIGNASDVFAIGFFVGFLVPVAGFVGMMFVRRPDSVSMDSFGILLPMYRAIILLNLAMWAWGCNLYCFSRCYLNHTYILGLNPEVQMQWTTMLTYAAIFTIVNCANLAAHFLYFDTPHVHYTLFTLVGCLAVFILPVDILSWDSRRSFLKALGRCIAVPLTLPYNLLFARDKMVTVQFRDFFLADQLVSASILLTDLSYTACFGLTGAWHASGSTDTQQISLAKGAYCMELNGRLKPLVVCWPYVWRSCQCIVMLIVTKNKAHLANLGKYLLGLLVVLIGALATSYSSHPLAYTAWVLATFAAQFYSWVWDVLMDWGWKLFDFSALWRKKRGPMQGGGGSASSITPLLPSPYVDSKFKTRRKHLPWWIHLTAIPADLLMRFLFFTSVDEGLHPFLPDPGLLLLFLGINEMLRRCYWNVLRIENEQLHNLESYRSKTDDVPEPLNEIFGEDWVNRNSTRKGASEQPSGYETFGVAGEALLY